ncbi:MAG: bifunctional diaminohydroxyphosphoribosylaminopyrimidine deaminase/5-amino-6-(5-phosphoribosylamino)uracil reductase RibD [Saprospiraceae bacterium]
MALKEDDRWMRYCFECANQSNGLNKQNPLVGAVIVHHSRIIGSGFHKEYGGLHAEINALSSVKPENKHLLEESTMYVSLEPCSHYGKTPPCVHAILHSKIKRVVIGTMDINPIVRGQGIKILQESGVEVTMSDLDSEAKLLLRPFSAHIQHRPYIILKSVQSQDHFIGQKNKKIWLSNNRMKVISHHWRAQTDAILVGKNTVLSDNPALTTRQVEGNNPIRILLDPNLSCPTSKNIFDAPGKVWIYNKMMDKEYENLTYIQILTENYSVKNIVEDLFKRGVLSLMVEGGAFTIQQFLNENLWDEARIIQTNVKLCSGIVAPSITGKLHQKKVLGNNTLLIIHKP